MIGEKKFFDSKTMSLIVQIILFSFCIPIGGFAIVLAFVGHGSSGSNDLIKNLLLFLPIGIIGVFYSLVKVILLSFRERSLMKALVFTAAFIFPWFLLIFIKKYFY